MTEVVTTASQQRHPPSAPTGPVTRSAMAAARPAPAAAGATTEPAEVGRQHGSETSPTTAPLSSSDPPARPPKPASSSEESPRRGITRKRAASINTEEANRPKIENLSLSTPATAASPRHFDGGNLICLCTPAPKVPRPRNAFILYRQHHQAQVVQQNPGLANPEISKIIGEQWRLEPEERKNQWKLLAEEEKQRHQRQFPDYRYQPRRGNKAGGAQSTRPAAAPGEDPHHCPKCGGRYIATPRTPQTPFMTPTTSKPGSTPYGPPPLGPHQGMPSRGEMSRYGRGHPLWSGSQSSLYDIQEDYDRAESPNEFKRRRYNAAGRYHNFHALPSPPPPFPDHHPASSSHPHPRQSSFSNPPTPAGYTPGPAPLSSMLPPRTSPGPGPGPGPGPMPPPPRPSHSVPVSVSIPTTGPQYPGPPHLSYPRTTTASTKPEFDESLRLPPLQTHLPTSPDTSSEPSTGGIGPATAAAVVTGGTGLGILNPPPIIPSYSGSGAAGGGEGSASANAAVKRERDAAARSIEAMVMSISFVNKLRVLESISPPLGVDKLGSMGMRGPVIAVEGPDQRLVRAVAEVVERALRAASPASEGGWEVRCWEDGSFGSNAGGEDVSMVDAGVGSASGSASRHGSQASITTTTSPGSGGISNGNINPFTAYLRTIADWHAKSAEIVQFVTGTGSSPTASRQPRLSTSSATTTSSSTSTTDPNMTEPESEATPGPSGSTSTSRRHPLPSHPISPTSSTTTAPPTGTSKTQPQTQTQPATGQKKTKLPIALLPSGFSLSLSDRFACAVPIADAYAPVDHWQWMATLWRGIVGADLVVYVSPKVVQGSHHGYGGVGGGGAGEESGAGGIAGGSGMMGGGTVEVRSSGLIVVKVPVPVPGSVFASGHGYGHGQSEAVVVDEKMERRLGFEVVEWVRSAGWVGPARGSLERHAGFEF